MKILYYGESPAFEMGACQVSKHLVSLLSKMGHTIEIVPINHTSSMEYDTVKYPYVFHFAPKSEMHNIDNAVKHILEDEYDLLFLTGDINILESLSDAVLERKKTKDFPVVTYGAIDADIFNYNYLRCLTIADYPVVFSQFSRDIVLKHCPELREKLQIIYHGCEPEVFYPLQDYKEVETTRKVFACEADTFLVVNVNRNQVRKDLGRTMYAFHLFHQKYPNSVLYLHAKMQDLGGHLPTQAQLLGLDIDSEIIFADPSYNEVQGFPRSVLNQIYNAADVCISTSSGEGWGLTTTECMASGTPFIGPRNTTFPEILGNGDRGYLVKSGGDDLWYIHYGQTEGPRDLVSVSDMVEKLEHVYHNTDEAREKAINARAWTLDHSWEHIEEEWCLLFQKIHSSMKKAVTV